MVRSKRRAFTLIELLVVISIIALLLSILMPGLQKAKQHALRMLCRTNLHSYGIASNMYLMEYDEIFPDAWNSVWNSCQGRDGHEPGTCWDEGHQRFPAMPEYGMAAETQRYCRWHNDEYSLDRRPNLGGPMWGYLQAEDINLCPVFAKMGSKFGDRHPSHVNTIPINPIAGYAQNAYLGERGAQAFGAVRRSSEVKSPARTFVYAEENMWLMNKSADDYKGEKYKYNISVATLNDTALLARGNPDAIDDYADAFGTFHSPPSGDYNEGTSNAVMMDGSINAVQPFDDGTFKYAWPKLGGKTNEDR